MAEAEVVKSADDEFDEAFGQAVAAVTGQSLSDSPPIDKDAKNEPVSPEDGKAAEASSEEGKADGESEAKEPAEDGGAGAEAPVGDAAAPDKSSEEAVSKPEAPAPVTSEDLAKLNEKLDKLQPKEPAKEPAKEAAPEPFTYSADEQKALDDYTKEWDEHAKVMTIREKKLVHDLEQRFTAALEVVLQSINEGLAPVLQSHISSAQERHFSKVSQAHADWETHKEGVSKWIDGQPTYLRTAMRNTYDNGDTEGTIDLLTRYKKEAGITAAPKGQGGGKVAPAKEVVSAEKVAATAPVSERRAAVQTAGVDVNDYDSAWKEAVGGR